MNDRPMSHAVVVGVPDTRGPAAITNVTMHPPGDAEIPCCIKCNEVKPRIEPMLSSSLRDITTASGRPRQASRMPSFRGGT
jgi:hypothetical protein